MPAHTQAAIEFLLRANDTQARQSIKGLGIDFSRSMTGMTRTAADHGRRINQALGQIQGFRDLKRRIQETEGQWRAATREVGRLAREMRDTESPTRQMALAFERAKRTAGNLAGQLDKERVALHQLRGDMQGAGINTAKLGEHQNRLLREMTGATRGMEAQNRTAKAFGVIGVRSASEVEREIRDLRQAYRDLSRSGSASARDLSNAHRGVERRIRELRAEVGGLDRGMRGLGGSIRNLIGLYAGFQSLQAASAFLKDSVLTFANFDDVMRQVGATSGATAEELKSLTELAEEMGATTRFSASQAAGGLRAMSLAGLSAGQQMAALPRVLELAAAGSTDLEVAAGIATKTLAQFGLSADALGGVNDILVTAFTSSATTVEDLGLALQYVGPVANAAGNSFQETAAVLALLAKNGFSGEKAGTALRAAYGRLVHPVEGAARAIQRMGLETHDAAGQLLPMTQILRNLRAAGASAGDMIELFGLEAAPAMTSAISLSSEVFEELILKFEQLGGVAGDVARQMEAGIGGAIRALESAWEGVRISIGKAVYQQSALELDELVKAINGNKDAIVELAVAGVDLAVMLGHAGLAIGEFLAKWKEVIVVLGAAALAVKAFSVASRALVAIQGAQWFLSATQAGAAFTAAVGAQGLAGALALVRTRMLSMIGLNLLGFFSSSATGALGFSLALGKLGLALGALWGVYKIGQLVSAIWDYHNAYEQAAEASRINARENERLAETLRQVSEQVGRPIPDAETFLKLQREGIIVADRAAGRWRLAARAVAEGMRDQRQNAEETAQEMEALFRQRESAQRNLAQLEGQLAQEQKERFQEVLAEKVRTAEESYRATEQAVQKSLEAERRLTDEIRSLEERKRDARLSTEEKIRALRERDMSEEERQSSRAETALEKLNQARELIKRDELSARDAQWAETLARQAQDAFANLTDTAAALEGVSDAGDVLGDLYSRQEEAAREALARQTEGTTALRAALEQANAGIAALRNGLDSIPDTTNKTVQLQAEVSQAASSLAEIDRRLRALQDRTVTVTVQTVEAHAGGGFAGLRKNGLLPGYGGGDRVRALLEDGEFVVRKERTRMFPDLLRAINSAPLSVVERLLPNLPRFQEGGIVNNLEIPPFPRLSLAAGGQAGPPPIEGVVRLDLSMGGRPAASITSSRQEVGRLVGALRELERGLP